MLMFTRRRLQGGGDPDRGLLAAVRPEDAWVATATDAPACVVGKPIEGRFRLFDATGAYVHPDGSPADITAVEDARVAVPMRPGAALAAAAYQGEEHLVHDLDDHLVGDRGNTAHRVFGA